MGAELGVLPVSQAGHRIDVYELTSPIAIAHQRTLDDKAEFSVEADGRFIVDKYGQFEPLQIQPVIRQVDHGLHQGRAHTASLAVVAYAHADRRSMAPARTSEKRFEI